MQFAIIGKLWLFIPASVCFHLGLLGILNNGVCVGLYAAFYLVLALILTMPPTAKLCKDNVIVGITPKYSNTANKNPTIMQI